MTKTSAPLALLNELREGQRFLVTSHLSPDGDAVGSSLGLARLLCSAGKVAQVWLHDSVPTIYRHLPGCNRIHVGPKAPDALDTFDGMIVLECPTMDRSGLEEIASSLKLINIDHHLGNSNYGAANWVDSAAPAVSEMILSLSEELRLRVDEKTANCLLLALVSDTGSFRFSNTTARAFDAASHLVRAGAQPTQIAGWLFESRSQTSLKLLQEMLSSLEMHQSGVLATALLTEEMFARSGASSADTEGLIDFPRSLEGVEAVGLIRSIDPGQSKVSLRSRGKVNVEEVARRYGGGGHKNAAGFRIDQPPAEARAAVVEGLTEALAKADA